MTHYRYSKADNSLYPQPEVKHPTTPRYNDDFYIQSDAIDHSALKRKYDAYKSSILKVEGEPGWRDNHFVTEGVHFEIQRQINFGYLTEKEDWKPTDEDWYLRAMTDARRIVAIPLSKESKPETVKVLTAEEMFPFMDYMDSMVNYEEIISRMKQYAAQFSSPSPLKEELTDGELEELAAKAYPYWDEDLAKSGDESEQIGEYNFKQELRREGYKSALGRSGKE